MTPATSSRATSDELFRLIADSLPLLVWIAGPDKRCTYFNKPWCDFTGKPLEAEVGDGWADGVHASDRQQCLDSYIRHFDRHEPFTLEYRLRRHDGEFRCISDHAAPLFNADGSFAGYIGTCFDVTDVRQADGERRVANDRLRLAMESGRSVGWDWDLRTNRDTWFGDLSTAFGLDANVYVGHVDDFRRLVHPDDRVLVWSAVKQSMDGHTPYAAEFRIRWPNGTVRWVSARGQFYYSADGAAERMLGMAVDITERKDAEESLRRKERELNETQRIAGVGGWQWDLETDTVIWSEGLYRIVGRDPALPAVSYTDHGQIYSAESWKRLQGAVDTALQTGASYRLDLEMVRTDGTHRWITALGEAVRDATGRITGLRGTVQDITERKRAEEALSSVSRRLIEAQEADRARIARDLHDDIGQRLAALAMTLDHVTGLVPDSASRALAHLNELQRQTAEIAADVQALSHDLHSSRLRYLGLRAALQGFCEELSGQKHVTITFDHQNVPAGVPSEVSLCLFRVLQEALQNAVRHSQVDRFDVHLRGNGTTLELSVHDHGLGFDVDVASRGPGLGLTSMKERLKLIGGELVIESQSTRGTTVMARAPIRQA